VGPDQQKRRLVVQFWWPIKLTLFGLVAVARRVTLYSFLGFMFDLTAVRICRFEFAFHLAPVARQWDSSCSFDTQRGGIFIPIPFPFLSKSQAALQSPTHSPRSMQHIFQSKHFPSHWENKDLCKIWRVKFNNSSPYSPQFF